MQFTREEFEQMVQEILYTTPGRYDTLCRIATATLQPLVEAWCKKEDVLCGRGLEGDLLNSILLHLMKTVVHGFLRNDRTEGDYNDDPEGFAHWMTKVANNHKKDFVKRLRRAEYKTDYGTLSEDVAAPASDAEAQRERLQALRRAFDVVLSADVKVYKVLTWLAQVLFIVDKGLEHHKANELIVAVFEKMTLNEMYHLLLTASHRVPWMTITPAQHSRITAALQQPWDEELTYGEMAYGTFFMKYRGELAGKKSVSDWIHRMNGMIRRKTAAEDAAESAPSSTGEKKEGRG